MATKEPPKAYKENKSMGRDGYIPEGLGEKAINALEHMRQADKTYWKAHYLTKELGYTTQEAAVSMRQLHQHDKIEIWGAGSSNKKTWVLKE